MLASGGRGRLGIEGGCWGVEVSAHLDSYLEGTPVSKARHGEARGSGCPRPRGSLNPEPLAAWLWGLWLRAFHSHEPPRPAVKHRELFTRAQLSLVVGEGGRAPRPTSEKLDPAQGGCGQQRATAVPSCGGAGGLDSLGEALLMPGCTLGC